MLPTFHFFFLYLPIKPLERYNNIEICPPFFISTQKIDVSYLPSNLPTKPFERFDKVES